MAYPDHKEANPDTGTENAAVMAAHGITRIVVDSFRYLDFRYPTLRDAMDQAKRRQPELKRDPEPSSENSDEMAHFGITRVPVEFFMLGKCRYARLADLRIADALFHQEKFPEAMGSYKAFVHDYPNDPEVPYARYRIAKSLFEQSSQSILLPPLEERDLASVHDAYSTIQAFLQDYPNYKHSRELEFMLETVAGLLARHELYVARFYLNEDNFKAAVARCQYALRHYEGSGLEAEAMVLLGETYMKMKRRKKARAVFEQMLTLYPDSPFGIPARNFLKMLGGDPKAIRPRPELAAPQGAKGAPEALE